MVTLRECNETWFRKEENAKAVARPRKTRKKSGRSFGRAGKAMVKLKMTHGVDPKRPVKTAALEMGNSSGEGSKQIFI